MKLAIVGQATASHIGGSLQRAAQKRGHTVHFYDTAAAFDAPRVWRGLAWRLFKRAPRLNAFSRETARAVAAARPDLLIVTGTAPLTARALNLIKSAGVRCVNYATDDPWNPAFRSAWLLSALPAYDLVFTTRRANLRQLQQIGCTAEYLPFGYDEDLFRPAPAQPLRYDVFLAGHADRDRYALLAPLVAGGFRIALHGRDWERDARFRPLARGQLEPARIAEVAAQSAIALCPVRRANRDGHVMRTFELAAVRACILAEDTAEHRDIYGDTTAFFSGPDTIAQAVTGLLADPAARERSARAAHARIVSGANTYGDRLETMLDRVS